MNLGLMRRREDYHNDNKITVTILNGLTRTNGTVTTSGNWKTAKIVFEKPVYIGQVEVSSGSISYTAAVVVKNGGSIIASNVMRPLPVTLSINGYVKEIHTSYQSSGYCEVDGERIWNLGNL